VDKGLRLTIAEALQGLGLQDKTILVSPVGCLVFAYYYFGRRQW
jgi:2-oxoisovalerate ferredoxin oxidoreductase beta subunit